MSQVPPDEGTDDKSRGRGTAALARSSALMASGTLVSRVLGLVRVLLLAGSIGLLSGPANAWSTANTLPNTVYILLAGGILNVILVPSITKAMNNPDGGRDFTDRLLTLALMSLVGIAIVFTGGAALLTKLYAWTWSGDQFALAVAFAYLCLPQIFFYGLYTVLGQILNAYERFGFYMWAPVANNVVAIAGVLVFRFLYPNAADLGPGEWTGEMIWLLGGTATLGVLTQALVLIIPVYRSGFRYRPKWGFRGVGLGAASKMAMWMLGVVGVSQAGMWLTTNVLNRASNMEELAAGKIVYENAFLFFHLPHSMIATSLITAMFTRMSRAAHAQDLDEMGRQYRHGLRLLGVAMVPISVGLVILAPSITSLLLFQNTPRETEATAHVTMALVAGLAPYGIYILSGRIFHAFQDGRTPFKMQVVITAVAGTGALIAATVPPTNTAVGIGLAQTLAQTVAAVLGLIWVNRRLGGAGLGAIVRTYAKVLLATVVAAIPTAALVWGAHQWLDRLPGALVAVLVGAFVLFGVYGGVAHRLGVTEIGEVLGPVLRRLSRGSRKETQQEQPSAAQSTTSPTLGLEHAGDDARHAGKEHHVQGIEPGKVLAGRYALGELLAKRDDTLEYWSARDTTLQRMVAVTVLPSRGPNADVAAAFLDGARRTAGVDDPRLVRVLDVGEDDGHAWVVEEGLVEATSMATLIQEPLHPEEARRIVGEVATGLEAARRRGLHHLYLSPYAVLRTGDGAIKVSGVSVAAALEQSDELTAHESSLLDTADLVSLLYTGLTGYWPGEEMEGVETARRLADGSLPAPSELVGGVPGDLDALCRQVLALDYDPRRGPQTPGELAQQLSPWSSEQVDQDEDSSSPVGGAGRQGSYFRTSPRGSGAAGAAGAAGAGVWGAGAASSAEAAGGDLESDSATSGSTTSESATGPDTPADSHADADSATEESGASVPQGSVAAGTTTGATTLGASTTDSGEDATGGIEPAHAGASGYFAGAEVPADDGPRRPQTGLVLAILAIAVVVAVVFAWQPIAGLFSDEGDVQEPPPAAATETQEPEQTSNPDQAQETTEPTEDESEEQEPGEPIDIAGITSYDPQGDNDERNDIVDQAIDGDPATSWNTHTYLSSGWGGLKEGVGLAVDLGSSQEVSEVTVRFPRGNYGVEIYVSDEPGTDGESFASWSEAAATWDASVDEPIEGQYVTIWFNRAWAGPEGEIAYVSEITVR